MSALRPEVPALPTRCARLPVDERGYPVPFFVAYVDGKPDHRVADPKKRNACVHQKRCWICGDVLGRHVAFVAGPMCAINRVSGDPPMHVECADWAARACPFLTRPKARRREAGLPDDLGDVAGEMIARNPGVALVWVSREHGWFPDKGSALFWFGDPTEARWYAEGRPATRNEVLASFESGLPLLEAMAKKDGPDAERELKEKTAVALRYLPLGPEDQP